MKRKKRMPAKLAKVVAKAKKIQKKHPGKKWQTCMKEAAK